MGLSGPPQFTSRAAIADTILDARASNRLQQIIYILQSLYFAPQLKVNRNGTAASLTFHQFRKKQNRRTARAPTNGQLCYFFVAVKYRF